MQGLEALRRKISSAEDLQGVVKTMKALASANIRRYEGAVESLVDYDRTVELALQVVLRETASGARAVDAAPAAPLGALVFGSDQGMVGQFNEQMARFAVERLRVICPDSTRRAVAAVGIRLQARLEDMGEAVEDVFLVPISLEGVTSLVQRTLAKIEAWQDAGVERIVIFHSRPLSQASYEPRKRQVLPLDSAWLRDLEARRWPSRSLPLFTMDRRDLFAAVIREYLFVSLYQACAESLASENASRLASMSAAEKNIEERLEDLQATYHQQRQNAITEEILDIMAGVEALAPEDRAV